MLTNKIGVNMFYQWLYWQMQVAPISGADLCNNLTFNLILIGEAYFKIVLID